MSIRASVFALLTAIAVPAPAELAMIAWDARGGFERQFRIAPKGLAELCGRLRPGDTVRWQFESESAVDFNIHFHEGKDVRYPLKQDAVAEARGTFVATGEQDYCWMWSNSAARPAAMIVRLDRQAR